MRLLFGAIIAVVMVVVLTLMITVVAPYIAILFVCVVLWKLSKDEFKETPEE